MTYIGEVLETTRRARSMTQEQLADLVGMTQAALSRYEKGMRDPDEEVVARLAEALGVTARFFEHAGRSKGAMAVDVHMRRRQTARPTVWKQLEAQLNVYRMHTSLLFEEVSLRAEQYVPTFDPIDVRPSDAARMVRMQWRMPVGPVRHLMRWIEAAGCVVFEDDFGTTRVDGMSQWVGEHPVIYLNRSAPTDRKRLTMAHELGHLVLHATDVVEDMEQQATEFAAEFLMPMDVIKPQLRDLRVGRLHDLKREWGVSMQAIVERAFHARLMTAQGRTNFYKMISIKGWRTQEPVSEELQLETPALPQIIGQSLAARGFSDEEIAQLAGFATAKRNALFPSGPATLRSV